MTSRIILTIFVGQLAACAGSEPDQQELRTHEFSCIKSGYAVDTPEYTECVTNRFRKSQVEQGRTRESWRQR